MSRLEDIAVATMRDRMSKSSISELLNIKNKLKKECKGGNEYCIFEKSLLRDLYAYAIVSFLNMYSFTVFGGFVTAHVSGKPWNDIDVMMPSDSRENLEHILRIIAFLRLAFGFKPMEVQLHEKCTKYGTSAWHLSIIDGNFIHYINIDVVPKSSNKHMRWLPATVGKCLSMKDNVIALRSIPKCHCLLLSWKVDDVVEMLRNGKDVGLSFPHASDSRNTEYRNYWWLKINGIRNIGYVVDTFLGSTPPEPTKSS